MPAMPAPGPGGETHFRVEIVADGFAGKSRIERQRAVYALLADELAERVHALQLTTLAPDEDRGLKDQSSIMHE